MNPTWVDILGAGCLLFGALLIAGSGWGLYRFEDLYQRIHASGLATSLGTLSFFLGISLLHGGLGLWLTSAAVVLLSFLTGPLASHFIAMAGYENGVPHVRETLVDGPVGDFHPDVSAEEITES
ncbi:MAG: monovalent cation/H(+) antiporter subunit G [bacterium]|nr:monovalent cation/H(+) antiporter subunit G [bacterium]